MVEQDESIKQIMELKLERVERIKRTCYGEGRKIKLSDRQYTVGRHGEFIRDNKR